MAESGHWMQKARHSMEKRGTKGVFKKAAERAGMSTAAYAEKEKHAKSGLMRKRATEALNFIHAGR